MKSGGPWNLRGLRPEAREAARDAARQSGMSVGEWLNDVIRPEDEDYGERARYADNDDDRGNGRRDPYRESERESDYTPRRESRHAPRFEEPRRGEDRERPRHRDDLDRNPPRIREARRVSGFAARCVVRFAF